MRLNCFNCIIIIKSKSLTYSLKSIKDKNIDYIQSLNNHFFNALFAFLIVFIYSKRNALMILDFTHPAHKTPPYGLDTVFCLLDNLL
jgi:hypothetical protein